MPWRGRQDALDHEDEAIAYALRFGCGLDVPRGKKFVHMYVNELTLDMGEVGRRALELLYRRAVSAGAIKAAPALEVVQAMRPGRWGASPPVGLVVMPWDAMECAGPPAPG